MIRDRGPPQWYGGGVGSPVHPPTPQGGGIYIQHTYIAYTVYTMYTINTIIYKKNPLHNIIYTTTNHPLHTTGGEGSIYNIYVAYTVYNIFTGYTLNTIHIHHIHHIYTLYTFYRSVQNRPFTIAGGEGGAQGHWVIYIYIYILYIDDPVIQDLAGEGRVSSTLCIIDAIYKNPPSPQGGEGSIYSICIIYTAYTRYTMNYLYTYTMYCSIY